jgi:hypothetical protein
MICLKIGTPRLRGRHAVYQPSCHLKAAFRGNSQAALVQAEGWNKDLCLVEFAPKSGKQKLVARNCMNNTKKPKWLFVAAALAVVCGVGAGVGFLA